MLFVNINDGRQEADQNTYMCLQDMLFGLVYFIAYQQS